jgi:hypothetical protein
MGKALHAIDLGFCGCVATRPTGCSVCTTARITLDNLSATLKSVTWKCCNQNNFSRVCLSIALFPMPSARNTVSASGDAP